MASPARTLPVQSRAEVLDQIAQHRNELTELGVETLWLVGSAARDELRPDSDVDVLVELSRPLGLGFLEIGLSLETWLGRPVDVGMSSGLHDRVRERVRREAIRAA
ncbi:nucleotidyltransferase family protein [Deinococcus sp. UYEF24]